MRSRLILGGTVAVLLVTLAWSADQNAGEDDASPAAAAEAMGIAVIDVARVFRDHRQFQGRLESLRNEMEEAKRTLAVRQVEIENTQRKLQSLRPGTPDHEKTQLLLTRLQTELKLYNDRLQQQFSTREMSLYAEVYEKIAASVEQYARQHNIRLVLRSNETTIDPENRASVLGAVNRQIVFQQGLDITETIVQQLNEAVETPN